MTVSGSAPTVVLVHGAWADSTSWHKVIGALLDDHIPVIAAPIPLTTLSDDVAALDRTIGRTQGPVIVVGHAYAGAVIGATAHARVAALVYIAALAPDATETVADVFYRGAPSPHAPELTPDVDGFIWLPANAFREAFAQNASPDEQELLAKVQRPIHSACITTPVTTPRWRQTPTWYLRAEHDRMIDPDTQTFMAERIGATMVSHQVDHTPLITAPDAVVDVIAASHQYVQSLA